jgi:phosphorylcholine metabolism protein LicD
MAYNITLEGKNLVQAEHLLSDVITIFESCNVAYWLEGGTLLGLRREGRLLPWDNDLDISIHESEFNKLSSLISTLKKNGYRVRTRVFEKDSDIFKKGNLRMIKIRTKRFFGLLKGNVCLDVFIKYTKNNKTYWEIANKVKNVPSEYYDTFKTIDFKGKSYAIPELTDEYLTYRYNDWETPVKDWDTAKDDRALS